MAGLEGSDIWKQVTTGHSHVYTGSFVLGEAYMERVWVGLGALFGLSGVGLSAYAAHVLSGAAQVAVNSAIEMQMFHALALLFVGLWARRGRRITHLAGLAFVVGIALFSGSITATHLRGLHLTQFAPAGGMTLMGGWLLLALSALRR